MTGRKHIEDFESDPVVRVFISSTFEDLREERHLLATQVFPKLRMRFRPLGLEVVDIDLRWGITEAQANRGDTVRLCKERIKECSHFIGIIGSRYGWVPSGQIPSASKQVKPRLEHGPSIIELEMLRFRANQKEHEANTFLYFRDPSYLPPYLSPSDEPEDGVRLERLKALLRKTRARVKKDYPDPQALAQVIFEDLKESLEKYLPDGGPSDPLDIEAAEQMAFVRSRSKVFVRREADFERLKQHVESDDPPLVIVGSTGSGKSALLANWFTEFRQKNPNAFLLAHFIGSTAQSTDIDFIRKRIIQEIKRRYNIQDKVPDEQNELQRDLPEWLAKASAHGPLVLILDGVDQVDDGENGGIYPSWMPSSFPPKVRVIISKWHEGKSRLSLDAKDWPHYEMPELNLDERKLMLKAYLGEFRKELNPERIDRIVGHHLCGTPLFLAALLEELRLIATHDTLDSLLGRYLKAESGEELFSMILQRLEEELEPLRPGLLRDACCLLWASRTGLKESELVELLGQKDSPLPQGIWSSLYVQIEQWLVSRMGALVVFHGELRRAIYTMYLEDRPVIKDYRKSLADFFREQDSSRRRTLELPFQLERLKDWNRLKEFMGDYRSFNSLVQWSVPWEMSRYWSKLKPYFNIESLVKKLVSGYEDTKPRTDDLIKHFEAAVHLLLTQVGALETENLASRYVALSREHFGSQHEETADALLIMGLIQDRLGKLEEAESHWSECFSILERVDGNSLRSLADNFQLVGLRHIFVERYSEGECYLTRAIEILENICEADDIELARVKTLLASSLLEQGKYEESIEILEDCLPDLQPDASWMNSSYSINCLEWLARAHAGLGYWEKAGMYLDQLLAGYNDWFIKTISESENVDLLAWTANWFVGDDKSSHNDQRMEKAGRALLEIGEKTYGPQSPKLMLLLTLHASFLIGKKSFQDGEALLIRAVSIWERNWPGSDDENYVWFVLAEHDFERISMSHILSQRYAEAQYLLQKKLEIMREFDGFTDFEFAMTRMLLARSIGEQGEYRKAIEILEDCLHLFSNNETYEVTFLTFGCLQLLARFYAQLKDWTKADYYLGRWWASNQKERFQGIVGRAIEYSKDLVCQDQETLASEEEQREMLTSFLRIRQETHGNDSIRSAPFHAMLGAFLIEQKCFSEGEAHVLHALSIYEKHFQRSESGDEVGAADFNLLSQGLTPVAMSYILSNRHAEAEEILIRGIAMFESLAEAGHADPSSMRAMLAHSYGEQERLQEAVQVLEECLPSPENEETSPNLDYCNALLAQYNAELMNWKRAEIYLDRWLEPATESTSLQSPDWGFSDRFSSQPVSLLDEKHRASWDEMLEKTWTSFLRIKHETSDSRNPALLSIAAKLGMLMVDQKRIQEAEPHLLQALSICEANPELWKVKLGDLLRKLADWYVSQDRQAVAEKLSEQVSAFKVGDDEADDSVHEVDGRTEEPCEPHLG